MCVQRMSVTGGRCPAFCWFFQALPRLNSPPTAESGLSALIVHYCAQTPTVLHCLSTPGTILPPHSSVCHESEWGHFTFMVMILDYLITITFSRTCKSCNICIKYDICTSSHFLPVIQWCLWSYRKYGVSHVQTDGVAQEDLPPQFNQIHVLVALLENMGSSMVYLPLPLLNYLYSFLFCALAMSLF